MIFLREMTVNEDLASVMSGISTPYLYEMVSGNWSRESFASGSAPPDWTFSGNNLTEHYPNSRDYVGEHVSLWPRLE